jgi:geranylgeranyl diphosphate synthase type II
LRKRDTNNNQIQLMNLEQAKSDIEDAIKQLQFSDNPPELYEPIRYLLSIGGKRMRPMLTLLGYYLYKDSIEKVMKPALAVEVFHNFTLMHDDIMDNAPKRRGMATVHEKWNANIGILSGDAMLIEAYNLLLDIEPSQLKNIFSLFNKCALEVCEGQQKDMNFEQIESVSVEQYLDMIRQKTSVLLGFALQLGALLGGASQNDAQKLCEFGVNIGLGFQLKDDLLDVYGNPEKFGKQVGGDIISNKKTYLLIRALEKADLETKKKLDYWIGLTDFISTEKVEEVTKTFTNLGIEEETELLIQSYFEKAFKLLDEIEIEGNKRDFLINFTKNLIHREN